MTAAGFERFPLFQRRPAICILLAVAAGIAFANTTEDPYTLLRIALIAMPIAFCSAFILRKQSLHLLLATFIGAFAFGVILITASVIKDNRSLLAHFGDTATEVALVGEITEVREADNSYIRLKCDSVIEGHNIYAVNEAAGIYLNVSDNSKEITLKRGATIKVFGELSSLGKQRNPYAFDFDGYLRSSEDINALMYCDSYYDIKVLGHDRVIFYDHVLNFFSGLRITAKTTISEIVPDTLVRGFILAMVLGERKALPESIWEDFQQAGLSHILVVSGFNLGITAWALYIVLRLLRLGRREVRIALVMAATLFYGALVGPQPSVIRAVIVVELILVSRLLERKSDLANVTAGAALIDLALAPDNLFNVSFQLSYGAVFSLALIAPALDRFFLPDPEKKPRPWHATVIKGAIGTAAVLLGTLPIVLFHFHQVSVIAIVTNLLSIPLASLATILSVLLFPLAAISTALASLYVDAVTVVIYAMRSIASFAKELPFAVIRLPHPSAMFITLYVVSLLYIIRSSTRQMAMGRTLILAMFAFGLTSVGFGVTRSYIKENALSVIFFDVGQGDATFIATPGGKYYMIDAGGLTRSGNSIAERSIFPFLDAEQVAKIDAGFATHMHLDHYGGFVQLAEDRQVAALYSCGGKIASPNARALDSIVFTKRLPVTILEKGNTLKLDDEVTAYVLSPGKQTPASSNERSLVMKIVYRNTSVLLLADISAETEEALVSNYGKFLQSDIVKVAHHGSLSSSSPTFISQAHPQYAVFSCGRRNRHGHPHRAVVQRWVADGAAIRRTDLQGACIFTSDGESFEQVNWR